jgi:hypothetical protein
MNDSEIPVSFYLKIINTFDTDLSGISDNHNSPEFRFLHLVKRINNRKTKIAPIIILAMMARIIQILGGQGDPLHRGA